MAERPGRVHVYQNHHLDSTRWDGFEYRPDDVIISTSYKAGTTWMQTIVANLIFWDREMPAAVSPMSPWLDMRIRPLDQIEEMLSAQQHRRFIKTHLPLDGLEYRDEVKYIVVGRDARDVFMSLYNHWSSHTETLQTLLNETPGRVGPPLPRCPEDINWLWRQWIQYGWFEWESDGWPYWSHLHHCRTWWEWRHLPNVLLVHYNDLKSDLEGEMRRIAEYLAIDVAEDAWPRLVDAATFETMKRNADAIIPGMDFGFRDGAESFLYKGTNRRWQGVLTEEELDLYPEAVARVLPPEAGAWLENGRHATG